MKEEFKDKNAYTIILYDMDLQDGQYVHQYKIFELLDGQNVNIESTDWKSVDDDFFLLHEDDLGMEIFSKRTDGKYNNLVTPPGFTHFVGNEQFGNWTTIENIQVGMDTTWIDSDIIWQFNETTHPLESELGLTELAIKPEEYQDFQEKYYLNRPYYGDSIATDSTKYGTRSRHWVYIRPLFYTRRITKNNFDKPYGGSFSYENRGGGGFGK